MLTPPARSLLPEPLALTVSKSGFNKWVHGVGKANRERLREIEADLRRLFPGCALIPQVWIGVDVFGCLRVCISLCD